MTGPAGSSSSESINPFFFSVLICDFFLGFKGIKLLYLPPICCFAIRLSSRISEEREEQRDRFESWEKREERATKMAEETEREERAGNAKLVVQKTEGERRSCGQKSLHTCLFTPNYFNIRKIKQHATCLDMSKCLTHTFTLRPYALIRQR